ncbi:hypothetical protein [Elizabethkingia ursingii]|uniref:hypothetical protein n=1 Tax=Elizabethkingia ursingii TaxID=1756150 RepID=UPI0020115A51|nr:hypothetical protein [Elizabethkingia ursingii]MCL1671736.1 hypothetical protein [Elizabethkingia ursingii]
MKNKNIKIWIISLWYYIWYKPHYVCYKSKVEYDEDNIVEYDEHRYYIKKRAISWILLFPVVAIPLFIFGGLKELTCYFMRLFSHGNRSVNLGKKKIPFKAKLDIVRIL